MICPECRGKGTAIYYCEIPLDENNVVVKKYEDICHTCHGGGQKPQTRADHLRAMNDERMADALMLFVKGLLEGSGMPVTFEEGFREELLHQLQQPVKDGENDGD